MTPPRTYADWSDCLVLFESGSQDAAVLAAMSAGSLSWTGGVASLFSQRVSDVVNLRLKRAADEISRDLRLAGDHGVLANALLNARRKLAILHQFSRIAPFPRELADLLESHVRRYAEQAQQSLEDSARSDRSGQLASILRNNSLLRYAEPHTTECLVAEPTIGAPALMSPQQQAAARRRRTFLA